MKKARYFLEFVLLSLFLGLSKSLSPLSASNFGAWVGRTVGPRLAASRKARKNIKMIHPDKSEQDVEIIVTGMWENLGRVMMEYPHIETIAKNHTEIVGLDRFTGHLEDKETVAPIFISAHIGNWEICPPAFLYKTGIKVNPVYRAPNNPFVDKLLNKKRSMDKALTPIPKSRSGTRCIVETLKKGEGVGLLIDQKYNEGVVANFMGYPAKTSNHFITMSKKFNCPIVPLHMERLNGINFRITVCDIITIDSETEDGTLNSTHDLLQSWIDARPEQWLWLHRRWMTKQEIERHENDKKK